MFKVTFASTVALDGTFQTVFQNEHVEPCIEVAMLVHRYSNVPHIIKVVLNDHVALTLVLDSKENPTGKDKK